MHKIGPHIISGTSVPLGRPAVAKLVNPSVAYVAQVRQQVGAECLIIVRWVQSSQPLEDPERSAREWYNRYIGAMQAMQQVAGPNIAFEGYNEIPDGVADLYVWHEVERLRLMHAAGLRSVVGNFSVGTPDLPVWTTYNPMFSCMRPDDLLGLHEYWVDTADIDNRYHCGRWTLANLPPWVVQIVVTECGRDIVEGKGAPGWKRTCSSPDEFLNDLRKYDNLMCQYDNVIGGTPFTMGNAPQWEPFDTTPVWAQVVAETSALPAQPITPPPAPEPIEEETVSGIVQVPSPNFGYPRGTHGRNGYKVEAIVFHIMEGSLAGCDSWLRNPGSNASYHYGVGKKGEKHQYVQEADAAWANGIVNSPTWPLLKPGVNPNLYTLSIALEGMSGDSVPEAQYQALLDLSRDVLARHDVEPSALTLIGHCEIDSVNRARCPGAEFPWVQLFADLPASWSPPPVTDLASLAIEARWNVEEAVRELEAAGVPKDSPGMRRLYGLIDLDDGLLYRLENALKAR